MDPPSNAPPTPSHDEVTREGARVTEPDRTWIAIAMAVLVPTIVAVTGRAVRGGATPSTLLTAFAAIGGILVVGTIALVRARSVLTPTRIHATRARIRAGGSRFITTRSIRTLTVTDRLDGVVLTLTTFWRMEKLWLATRGDAEALRAALDRPTPARAELPRERSALPYIAISAALCFCVSRAGYPMVAILSPFVGVLAVALQRWSKLVVGEDGVRLRSWRGARFVPFASVARVERSARSVALRLRSGEKLTVTTAPMPFVTAANVAVAGYTLERAYAAWNERASARVEAPLVHLPPTLDGAGPPRYRIATVPRERLLELAEDTAADVALRAAAAGALAQEEDGPTQERLRRVAQGTASSELQRAGARRR